MYIITPEPLEVLNEVQVLVKGSLEILDCLYKVSGRFISLSQTKKIKVVMIIFGYFIDLINNPGCVMEE